MRKQNRRAITNAKGGVGKSTTSEQLAHEFARQGKRVLVLDGDSQRSITINLNLDPRPGQPTIYALVTEPAEGIAHIARTYSGTAQYPVSYPGGGRIDVIPGAKTITGAAAAFDRSRDRQPVNRFELVLPYVFDTFCEEYDEILMDSSPSTDRVTEAFMLAATGVVAPVACEMMALDGLQGLLETLTESNHQRAGLRLPGQTELEGILMAKVLPDQLELLGQFQQTLDASHIPHFGRTYVPYTTAGWKSPGLRIPIAVLDPADAAARAYAVVAHSL